MNVVFFEKDKQQLIHAGGTVKVPPEVLAQSEEDTPDTIVTQFARKLRLLARDETVWVVA